MKLYLCLQWEGEKRENPLKALAIWLLSNTCQRLYTITLFRTSMERTEEWHQSEYGQWLKLTLFSMKFLENVLVQYKVSPKTPSR